MVLRATGEQIEALVPLFDAYRVFYQQPSDMAAARRFLGERLHHRDSVIFVALRPKGPDGTAVGFAQLYPSFSSAAMKPIWILNDLFVLHDHRRAGVARELMQAARRLALETSAARLTLATARDNAAARALYESTGYQLDLAFDHYNLFL